MHKVAGACWRGQPLSAVLFDLDGTLLDTVADIALALNRTLTEYACAAVAENAVRQMIGRGSPILIERALAWQGRRVEDAVRAAMVERFFTITANWTNPMKTARNPIPAPPNRSGRCTTRDCVRPWSPTSQHRFAGALIARVGFADWVDVVVGGDSCARRKPDPQPLLFACESLQVPPSDSLMVGDSVNDVQAARAAGIPVVCVSYGYNEGRSPLTLDCDALLDSLAELPGLLQIRRRPAARC